MPEPIERIGVDAAQIEKRFVDRIYLYGRCYARKQAHDAARHVAVEREVGRKDIDAVLPDRLRELEVRLSHSDPEPLGLVRACYDAAVVVG